MSDPTVVIVGAGPAGMMLAYQLVRAGVSVRVLERHPDFNREFRGELMQASVVAHLQAAGIFPILLQRGLALPNMKRQMYVGHSRKVKVPGSNEPGAVVNQPGFLALLHELCGKHPHYRLDFDTTVLETEVKDGRVVAVTTRDGRVEGELFIVCNGRNSPLRKSCGLQSVSFETTADALWVRFDFSDQPASLPSEVEVHMFGKGVVVALQPASGNRLHVAYSAAEDLSALKKDLPALRARLVATCGAKLGPILSSKLSEQTELQLFKIIVDRVKPWHAPGILFLGDAAHTMSPSGGQGLNVAIRDTFAAANALIPALKNGALGPAVFEKLEADRLPEIDAVQAGQTRAGQMVMRPLPALHMMFTMLPVMMTLMPGRFGGSQAALPQPGFLAPV